MQKLDSFFRLLGITLILSTLSLTSSAQDDDLKPVTSKYAIRNATIVQAPGKVITNGTVLIENGIIQAVGTGISIPADAWVVDADSMFVYAGFISGLSNIGVEKPKEVDRKDDRKMTGNPTDERAGITPGRTAREMLKADEKSVADFRKLGFTSSLSVPHNGMLPGTGTLILLGGKDADEMVVKDQMAMFSQLAGADGVYPNTVIGVMAKYRDLYRKASQARAYEKEYESDPVGRERPESNATLQALYPVVSKQMPVAFRAEGIKDVMRVLALQKDLGFQLMLGEVKQGWDAIPNIKASGASVFLSLDMPEWKEEEEKKDQKEDKEEEKKPTPKEMEEQALKERQNEIIRKYYMQAATFNKNGIRFGFSTLEVKSKDFKSNLLKMIENGLTEDQALAALTTNPASILGVSKLMGTIEPGKMANLIVTDTAYFTKDSNVRYVFVDGVKYEFEVKEKKKKKSNGEAIDAAGVWNYTTETPQGNGSGIITITGSPGNYSGTMTLSFNNSTNELKNIEVDGNTVTFSVTTNVGQEITIEVSMTIDGDTFEGTLSVAEFGSFPMEGSKDPE